MFSMFCMFLCVKVKENQEAAHKRQKEGYAKRKAKGVKTFDLQVGQLVMKKKMSNVGRKGGACDPIWNGPFRLVLHKYIEKPKLYNSSVF